MARITRTLKSEIDAHLSRCGLCPRNCRVNRLEGEKGFCGVGAESRVFADFVHFGEELELVPSQTVFLTGCNMRCQFCTGRDEVLAPGLGEPLDVKGIRRRMRTNRKHGAKTVSIIGGEPACNLPGVLGIFAGIERPLPVVWNSNFYFSPEILPAVLAVGDVFLGDLKFGNDQCAWRLTETSDYSGVVRTNLVNTAGRGRLILRHLLMPGHIECCTIPVLEWAARELSGVEVSILTQYLPPWRTAADAQLNRTVSDDERAAALDIADKKGLRLVEQEETRECAKVSFRPGVRNHH